MRNHNHVLHALLAIFTLTAGCTFFKGKDTPEETKQGATTMEYKKVTIYTKPYCSFCVHAKNLLNAKNIPYTEIEVNSQEILEKMISLAEGRRTVPQIFFDETPIGGFDRLSELEKSGQLNAMVNK